MHRPILPPLRFASSLAVLLALAASPARADDEPAASTIRVTGEASVTSRPDRVELDFGVVTRAPNAQRAANDNARVLQRVLTGLRSALGPRADIQTISYSLQPDYQYAEGAPPKITGYTAINTVRVKQDDPARIGMVIDAATRAGANQIDRIRFLLKDEDAAKTNALRMAALEARTKANSLASALGLQVARIHSVEEVGPTPRPYFDLEVRSGASTPIVPGRIETTATVTLTVELARSARAARR